MANRHTFAKGMVEDAVGRLRDPAFHMKLEAMDEKELRLLIVTLINQQVVVTGAVLEEVSVVTNGGWQTKLKTGVIQTVPPFAGMGGLLFLLSVMGVI